MAEAKNGVWLDKDTGKVVRTQPERGRLLVSAGKEITPNVQALMDRYEDNYANFEQATAPAVVETRAEPDADEKPAPKKRTTRKSSTKG